MVAKSDPNEWGSFALVFTTWKYIPSEANNVKNVGSLSEEMSASKKCMGGQSWKVVLDLEKKVHYCSLQRWILLKNFSSSGCGDVAQQALKLSIFQIKKWFIGRNIFTYESFIPIKIPLDKKCPRAEAMHNLNPPKILICARKHFVREDVALVSTLLALHVSYLCHLRQHMKPRQQ